VLPDVVLAKIAFSAFGTTTRLLTAHAADKSYSTSRTAPPYKLTEWEGQLLVMAANLPLAPRP
jgi:hypothetical protein